MNDRKLTLSFKADAHLRDWLLKRSIELSVQRNKKIAMSEVIITAISEHKRKIEKK